MEEYKKGGSFCLLFGMLKSLTYVPPNDIKEAFDLVIRHCTRNQDGSLKFDDGSNEIKFTDYVVKVVFGSCQK